MLKTRFKKASTLPKTRDYHCFKPLNDSPLQAKIISSGKEYKAVRMKKQKIIHIL